MAGVKGGIAEEDEEEEEVDERVAGMKAQGIAINRGTFSLAP